MPYIEPLAKYSSTACDSDESGIFPCEGYLAMRRNSAWSIIWIRPSEKPISSHAATMLSDHDPVFRLSLMSYVMSLRI
jgi:hypothetical protein